jgi:uncharacterized protein (DUF305 family)
VDNRHHMSAIMMAEMVRDGDGQVADLAKKIHDEQLKDVQEMNTLRDKLRG